MTHKPPPSRDPSSGATPPHVAEVPKTSKTTSAHGASSANSAAFNDPFVRYQRESVCALLDCRPLRDLSDAEFEDFLYASRMYPSRSRFMPGNAEWLAPRRDITVRVALESLRERLQQATASAELVSHLERDFEDENTLKDDDEALVVSAAVRDNLREALGMLGVVEQALMSATLPDLPGGAAAFQMREPAASYRLMAA